MSFVPLVCRHARDLLAELAVGALPHDQSVRVERHVETCAGCRKEFAELQEGAARIALSLAPVDPPSSLEHGVLERVALASGRRVPVHAHRRLRTQARRLGTVAVVTGLVAALSMGWAFSERRNAASVHRETVRELQQQTRDLNRTIRQLGAPPEVATLRPTTGSQGTGGATMVNLPGRDDVIFVEVSLVPRSNPPYTVRLQTRSGKVFNAGTLVPTTKGTLVLYDNQATDDLSRVQFVSILDSDAHPVMTGAVHVFTGKPSG
jgi:Putative zinc-finger